MIEAGGRLACERDLASEDEEELLFMMGVQAAILWHLGEYPTEHRLEVPANEEVGERPEVVAVKHTPIAGGREPGPVRESAPDGALMVDGVWDRDIGWQERRRADLERAGEGDGLFDVEDVLSRFDLRQARYRNAHASREVFERQPSVLSGHPESVTDPQVLVLQQVRTEYRHSVFAFAADRTAVLP
ncbi:MAG: hypothetical protein WCP29_09070 [Acidobacteriota bacterium]